METPAHVSTPRIAFLLTMAFSVAWLTGAHVMMDSEHDPDGYQANDYETSVWIAQHRGEVEAAEAPSLLASTR